MEVKAFGDETKEKETMDIRWPKYFVKFATVQYTTPSLESRQGWQ
jgi:hypothetical protein